MARGASRSCRRTRDAHRHPHREPGDPRGRAPMRLFHRPLGASSLSALGVAVVLCLSARMARAADDHPDSPLAATPLPPGVAIVGMIDTPIDQDWFVVQPTPSTGF